MDAALFLMNVLMRVMIYNSNATPRLVRTVEVDATLFLMNILFHVVMRVLIYNLNTLQIYGHKV